MKDLATYDQMSLSITTESDAADVLDKMSQIDAMMARAKAIKEQMNDSMVEWIRSHGGKLELGDGRYLYVSQPSNTKCLSKWGTMQAILRASGGDLKTVAEMLASQPWKHGAVRQLIGDEQWKLLFRVERTDKVKGGGKIQRSL